MKRNGFFGTDPLTSSPLCAILVLTLSNIGGAMARTTKIITLSFLPEMVEKAEEIMRERGKDEERAFQGGPKEVHRGEGME